MKKLIVLSLVLLVSVFSANAQSGFGVKAGFSFNSMSDIEINSLKHDIVNNKTGFHVGVLYKIDATRVLSIQPELLYVQKGGTLDLSEMARPESYAGNSRYDIKSHHLQLPVNIQVGLDLMLFRPFVMVSPYLSYMMSKDFSSENSFSWSKNKLGYGVGLGAGLDIWKFQVSGKYNWDLGKASEFKWGNNIFKGAKNRSFELSLAFIF